MSFPDSVVAARTGSNNDRLSELIYENESLKIEVARMQDVIESTGALNVQKLQTERDNLQQSVTHLREQLEERDGQLNALRSSNERFTHIDSTLQQLITQLQSQSAELDAARQTINSKDAHIAELNAQMQAVKSKQEREDNEQGKQAKATSAATNAGQGALLERDRAKLQDEPRPTALRRQLATGDEQSHLPKKATTTKTTVGQSAAASSQQQQQQQDQRKLATQAGPAETTEAYVQRRVSEAVADLERRLREQTDINASLMAYKALTQQEQSAKQQAAALLGNDGKTRLSEQDQLRTKQQEAHQSMQRRVAQVLSGHNINKRDVETLLQEMLDYQETTEEDMRTRLLIKDIQAEEVAKVHRLNLSRVESENASLMAQLRDALSPERRLRSTHDAGGGDNNNNNNTNTRLLTSRAQLHSTQVGPRAAAAHAASVRQHSQQPSAPAHTDPAPSVLVTQYPVDGQVVRDGARTSCVPVLGVMASPGHTDNMNSNSSEPTAAAPADHTTTAATPGRANATTLACPACTFQQSSSNDTCTLCGWRLRQRRT